MSMLPEGVHSSTVSTFTAEGTLFERAVVAYQKVCGRRFGFRTRKNLSQPIHKMPTDILSRIFTLVVFTLAEDEKVVGGKKAIGLLAGVCHTWQVIVRNTPRMWNEFNISGMKLEWAETMLARSKATPLRIECPSPLTDRAISSALSSHFARIMELELTADPSLLLELFTTCDALPTRLQSLRLRSSSGHTTLEPMSRVLPIQMPSLENLELVGIALPHNLPPLPELRRLRLSFSFTAPYSSILVLHQPAPEAVEPGMSMNALLSFLDGTPSLEELEVHGVLSRPTSRIRDEGFKPVELPRLSWISFMSQHGENIAFITYIQYPPSARVQIECTKDPRQTTLAMDDLEAILSHFSSCEAAAKVDHASFVDDQSRLRLQASTANVPWLDIHIGVMVGNPQPFSLLSMLPCSNVQTLHISMYSFLSAIQSADWSILLRRYEHVREISADSVRVRFVRGLSPSEGDPAPLPRLKTLKLIRCIFDSEKLEGAWSRESLAVPVEQFLQERIHYDMPLDVLEIIDPFVGLKASTIDKLQQIIQVI